MAVHFKYDNYRSFLHYHRLRPGGRYAGVELVAGIVVTYIAIGAISCAYMLNV